MPPNHSRSTGLLRIALIKARGVDVLASMPSASRASALSGIVFLGAREDAAALRDQLAVVIVPARPRQLEQALALGPALRRIGIGVDEDVAVVEGGDQLERFDSSMPLPNTSPDMSPQPATVTVSVWTSTPISRKCRWTEIQAPLRGDAHRLVVVAVGCRRWRRRRQARSCARARWRWRCRRRSRCPCRRRRRNRDRRRRG